VKIGLVQLALSHGGAEQVGVMLANGLRQHGNDTFILTDMNEPVVYRVDDNIPVYDFAGKKAKALIKWIKAIKNIRHIIKKEKPDVIIGIMGLCTLVTYIACLGLRIPIVMTEHNAFERPTSAPFPLSVILFKFWINKLYKHITVLTEADKKVIGNKLTNVTVMPNPLLLKPVNDIPTKEKFVLAAGRVDAWHVKGFDTLICAWQKFVVSSSKTKDSSWCLKIAGAGKKESFDYLMNLLPDGEWIYNDNVNDDDNYINTKEKNIGAEKHKSQKGGVWRSEKYHIEFLGFHKDMESLYKKSEIFVLSSRYEGFGLVLIEAMSQGCACVACDYKGRQKEILRPEGVSCSKFIRQDSSASSQDSSMEICENGILCEPENVEALASALEKLMTDEEYRKQAQLKSVERSKYYSLDNCVNRWEEYLRYDVLA
jgi:glycosyltransferase involved in cell wall biosynthesis